MNLPKSDGGEYKVAYRRWFHFRHTWVLVGRTRIPSSVNSSLHFRCRVCGREKVRLGY